MRRLYTWLFLPLIVLLGSAAAWMLPSIRRPFYARFRTLSRLSGYVRRLGDDGRPRVWIHAASMGEFEHVKPIIKRFQQRHGAHIVVSFFSPSGFNHVKRFPGVGLFVYLPLDFPFIWEKIYRRFRPDMVLVSKHDVWPNQIHVARKQGVYTALVNASLSSSSSRTSPWARGLLGPVYRMLDDVFAISPEDAQRLQQDFGRKKVTVVGDTKFDQVLIRQEEAVKKNLLDPHWPEQARVLIFGSLWPQDAVHVLADIREKLEIFPDLKIILAPHDVSEANLKTLLAMLEGVPYRLYTDGLARVEKRVIVINTIGILADMYKYGHMAYVGGSFKQGIHNVMEPAIYGLPVMFGPKHTNSYEATELLRAGGALPVTNKDDFDLHLARLLQDERYREQTGEKARAFAMERCGATRKIMTRLESLL